MFVFGVMFFVVSKDPAKYKLILDVGILWYALGLGSYVVSLVTLGSIATFWWIGLFVDLVRLILFVMSWPKGSLASA
jgi:hypothetical protein